MRKGTLFLLTLALTLLLAFALGAALAGQGRPSEQHQRQMEALHLATTAKTQAIKVGFWGGLAAILLFGLAGVATGLVRAVWQRSRLIHPHANGLFPIVQGRAGRQTYYHDPNRQLAGGIAYGTDGEGTIARHLMPPGDRGEQLQVTTQAQAVQLTAAQGQGPAARRRQATERFAFPNAPHAIPSRLPEIVVLNASIPEERHLLTALRQDWEEG